MATQIPSQQDIYDLYKNEVQSRNPLLTDFEEGSKLDSLGGGFSTGGQEIVKFILDQFAKTFFATANGPDVTGSTDDLQLLAVDHFGDSFSRPAAEKAVGVVAFTRPTAAAGNVSILAGTIVKTAKDANGVEQRYATLLPLTMTGLSINASVQAVVAGAAGNVLPSTVKNIETSLTDPTIVVNNLLAFAGGSEKDTDAEYREFIRNKIETLRGATQAAIEAAATNVSGVVTATAIEDLVAVKLWNIATSLATGSFFYIPRVRLFIADANGTASQALLDLVAAAILYVRAAGVRVEVVAATAVAVNWSASLTLNPAGPNFSTLSVNTSIFAATMSQYIKDLAIGTGFDKGLAKLAMMAIWGPSGSNDITDMTTTIPTSNISASTTQKLVPGTILAST